MMAWCKPVLTARPCVPRPGCNCLKICQLVDSPHIKAVAMVNSFRRQGLVREGLCGSLASHLTRHCRKPLMLMQPVHVDTGLEHWSC